MPPLEPMTSCSEPGGCLLQFQVAACVYQLTEAIRGDAALGQGVCDSSISHWAS